MLNTTIYFAGSARLSVDRWLQDKRLSRLMSQLNDRNLIPRWVKFQREEYAPAKVFIDSGAYSAYTKGKEVDVDAYIEYLNTYGDAFTVMAQVDFIPGKSNVEQDPEIYVKAPAYSWENYLYMHSKLKPELRDKLIPVFHQGEDFKWLRNMLDWVDPETGRRMPYIGISPHTEVTSDNRMKFCKQVFHVIKESSNPNVHTHGFGMTALHLLKWIPFTSVDSTTWLQAAIHGQLLITRNGKLSPVIASERMLHVDDHFIYLSENVQNEISKQIKDLGFDVEPLLGLRSKALPKSQRHAATDEDTDDTDVTTVEENLINSISERQKFNALSMIQYLQKTEFEGLPKRARRIG